MKPPEKKTQNTEIVSHTCRAFIYQLIAAAVRSCAHRLGFEPRVVTDGQVCSALNPFSSNFPIWLRTWLTLNGSAVGLSVAIIVTY
jgi:hypothetical protein